MNDRDDPYLTDDGQLVFAVQRAPVDGGPRLVSELIDDMTAHGESTSSLRSLFDLLSTVLSIRLVSMC